MTLTSTIFGIVAAALASSASAVRIPALADAPPAPRFSAPSTASSSSSSSSSSHISGPGFDIYCRGSCPSTAETARAAARNAAGGGGVGMFGGHMYPGVDVSSDDGAYAWLLSRAVPGGDFVVLTADDEAGDGCALYNELLFDLGQAYVNSVSTVCFRNATGGLQDDVVQRVCGAAGIFMTGGDQSKYFDYWGGDSQVASCISKRAASFAPVGGSSAGLAVQGEYMYSALNGGVTSDEALADPFDSDVTLARGFLSLPFLENVITDTHFIQRNRMGRELAFLARVAGAPLSWNAAPKGIAISEHTAVLVDTKTGTARVIGHGPAYFLHATQGAPNISQGQPLDMAGVTVSRWTNTTGATTLDIGAWSFPDLASYTVNVTNGTVHSTQSNGSPY